MEDNDNALVMKPVTKRGAFIAYEVVRPFKERPDGAELWTI